MRRRCAAALLVLLLLTACATTRRAPSPEPTPSPAPTVPAPPTPAPTVPAPAPMPPDHTSEPLVRVLLERTSSPVGLPQPGRAYWVIRGAGGSWLWGPLQASVVGGSVWQVGAYRDPAAAERVAAALAGGLSGDGAVESSITDEGLVRVRVRWPTAPPAEPAAELARLGHDEAFQVPGGTRVRLEGVGGWVEEEGELIVDPQGDWPTAVGDRRYHGRLRLRASGGELLVVNQLNLESYLRGVLPAEMGPAQFPELEALKAQAVAARTYAVAHLGDHDDEGYDLCASPACQVYRGADAHHPLSDRAVEETAGLIAAYDGRPIDAMYTSTCGGHTEDAELLFPDRAQPYLRGVACSWEHHLRLEGSEPRGPLMDRTGHAAAVARQEFGLSPAASAGELVRAVCDHTGVTAHLPAAIDPETFAIALLAAAGIQAPQGLVRVSSGLDRLLVLSDLFGLELAPPWDGLDGDWPAAAVLAALELRGEVVRDSGEAVPHPDGVAIYPRGAAASEPLASPLPLWERWDGAYRRVPDAEVLPGTELERLRLGERVVALVVRRSGGADEADRRSAWRSWIREREWDELARRLEVPDLERLTVTRRGVSGRVVELSAVGRSGTASRLEGFPIRRALDLPENLFTMHVLIKPDGRRVVRFLGRGWGHGVGLCQNGAYGLARSGRDFAAILATYYTGVSLMRWGGEKAEAQGSP